MVANDKVHKGRKEGGLQALGRIKLAVGSDTGEGGDGGGRRRIAAQAGYEVEPGLDNQ